MKARHGLAVLLLALPVTARLVLPSTPPRGWNSFDLQWDRRYNTSVPAWNETLFREAATAMAKQLLPHGYDTIVVDGGWSGGLVDGYGRPVPDPAMWPSANTSEGLSFKPLADFAHGLGLKFGVWRLRGVPQTAVTQRLPVHGASPPTTVDKITFDPDACPAAQKRWCKCTWDQDGVGVDVTKPGAQAYYTSVVELYASWGVDLIKWDCMYDDVSAAYSAEEALARAAVEASARDIVLSLSPGGGMTTSSASWVARGGGDGGAGPMATMYRVTADFHARKTNFPGVPEHVFVVGNLSSSGPTGTDLIGANNSWPDLDIVDLGEYSAFFGTPTAQLHAVVWMMARSTLMYGGILPITDAHTLNLVTNDVALKINAESKGLRVAYRGNCTCVVHDPAGNACKPVANDCTALWWSTLGKCKAVAAINLGTSPADIGFAFADIGMPSGGAHTVTAVYEKTSATARSSSYTVHTEAMGGSLLVVSPLGVEPADC